VAIFASFLSDDGIERSGVVQNISVGGAFIDAKTVPAIGAPVTLRIEKLGHFDGRVVWICSDGFAVKFDQPRKRRVRMADRLTWLLNKGRNREDDRLADRFDQDRNAVFVDPHGQKHGCVVVDISTGGAFLETTARPPLQSQIILGRQEATIVRHATTGVGVAFAKRGGNDL
jgi:hypothetical protein